MNDSLWDNITEPDSTDVAPTLAQMRDVVVAEGASAQFRTQVTGKPVPAIQWYREGDLIPQSPDFQVKFISIIILV